MPAISFPQALALAKGANYNFPAKFPGIDLKTLLSTTTAIRLNQPSFVLNNSAPNLINSAAVNYTLASSTTINDSKLVYRTGGNLVDTAMKWTNGKSLGNWYQIQRHSGGTPTGGTVSVDNNSKLKITCGPNNTLLNRSVIHDTLFQRNGTQIIPESSATVVGWLLFRDKVNTTLYYKGYVESSDLFTPGTQTIDSALSRQKTFFVGYTYHHSLGTVATTLNVLVGSLHGFGFVPALSGGNYTWHAVVKGTRISNAADDYIFVQNTNLSALVSQKLKVNFTDGIITWFANNMTTPIATQTVSSIADLTIETSNPMYAAILAQKGGDDGSTAVSGVCSIYVEEAATWREFPTGGKSGLVATLSTGTNNVTLTTGNTTGLSVGMRLVKTSTGGGAFNAATTTNGTFIGSITNGTTFTVVSDLGVALNHATAGSITFDAGLIFASNNYEDTNTEITTTETQYHNTGVQLLKKLK